MVSKTNRPPGTPRTRRGTGSRWSAGTIAWDDLRTSQNAA